MKRHSNNDQATIEFALVLPLFMFCVLLILAVLGACLNVLALNDTARSAVRVAVTANEPQQAVQEMLQHSSTSASVYEDSNGIVTVSLSQPFKLWLVNIPIALIRIRASASMMREPPVVLG